MNPIRKLIKLVIILVLFLISSRVRAVFKSDVSLVFRLWIELMTFLLSKGLNLFSLIYSILAIMFFLAFSNLSFILLDLE